MKKHKYRIVRDSYLGYECQVKKWYFPFWVQMGNPSNTHSTLEAAKRFIEANRQEVVFEYD